MELTADGHPDKAVRLLNLGGSEMLRYKHSGDLADLENATSNVALAVKLTRDDHPEMPLYLSNMSSCRETRYKDLRDLTELEFGISDLTKAIELADIGHPSRGIFLYNLGNLKNLQFELLGDRAVLAAAITSWKAATQSQTVYPRHALSAARRWAEISYHNGDLTGAMDGYRKALEILPKVAWLGLDVAARQHWLLREKSESMAQCAATCAIQMGCYEEAVELLDLGRSVFWQQASSLRSDLQVLRDEAPALAEELESIGRMLDAGNFSESPDDTYVAGVNVTRNVGQERRRLVGAWEELLAKIRKLSKLEYFLLGTPFHQLRQAAISGRVVVVNVSQYGADALIFGQTGSVQHVPLPQIDLDTLGELSATILLQRPSNANKERQRRYVRSYLRPALRVIWGEVILPILICMDIPLEMTKPVHRIWWYPTGPLTFIPIHAAGSGKVDVSRLVISSYITTLSSLFSAQTKHKSRATRPLKLLAISQPDTPDQPPLPQSTAEVERLAHVARSANWVDQDLVRLNGSDATVDRVLNELNTCSWVHFACHGLQHPTLGMKSAFALHDGHLELGQIASKRLSSGEFAFLSVCHAASGLKDLPGESVT